MRSCIARYGKPGTRERSTNRPTRRDRFRKDFEGFHELVSNPRTLNWLIGASLAWFLMDFAYYGNTVSSPMVLANVAPRQSLLHNTPVQLLIFAVAAAPGYFVAALTMDKIGRKLIQTLGFGVMGAAFAAMALVPKIETPGNPISHHLRHQLFLHRIRTERDHLRLPFGDLPGHRQNYRTWDCGGDG